MEKYKSSSCSTESCQAILEELIKACDKQKKVAIELKEISENQKEKLIEYRETNSKLYDDIADLEDDIKEKVDFANKLRKQRNDLEREVKYLNEKVERKNDDILHIDFLSSKQKEISNVMMIAQRFENDDLKEQLDEAKIRIQTLENDRKNKVMKEISKEREMMAVVKVLEEELKTLQEINESKEKALKLIEEEKIELEDEIQLLQCETNVDTPRNEVGTVKSLRDELEDCHINYILNTVFQCKICDTDFPSKAYLKQHMKDVHRKEASLKLKEMQKTVTNQTQHLLATVNELIKQEISKMKEPCNSKYFCNINHLKQNWKNILSTEIIARFGEIKNGEREDHSGAVSRI